MKQRIRDIKKSILKEEENTYIGQKELYSSGKSPFKPTSAKEWTEYRMENNDEVSMLKARIKGWEDCIKFMENKK